MHRVCGSGVPFTLCSQRREYRQVWAGSVCAEVGSPPKTNGLFRYVYILKGI